MLIHTPGKGSQTLSCNLGMLLLACRYATLTQWVYFAALLDTWQLSWSSFCLGPNSSAQVWCLSSWITSSTGCGRQIPAILLNKSHENFVLRLIQVNLENTLDPPQINRHCIICWRSLFIEQGFEENYELARYPLSHDHQRQLCSTKKTLFMCESDPV